MSSVSEARRAGVFQGRPHYPGVRALFLGLLVGMLALSGARPAVAQALEGNYVLAGPAFLPGAGLSFGVVNAGRFVTREAAGAVGYRQSSDGSIRTVATVGGAIRILGARRTVLQSPRGRFDIDLGFRIGPAILFRFEESAIEKNKRFTLVADPFVRVGFQPGALFSIELGIHRPALRTAIWF